MFDKLGSVEKKAIVMFGASSTSNKSFRAMEVKNGLMFYRIIIRLDQQIDTKYLIIANNNNNNRDDLWRCVVSWCKPEKD